MDGNNVSKDENYTSETATLTSSWRNFQDPETNVSSYSLDVFINDVFEQRFPGLGGEQLTDHSLSFHHGDYVKVQVTAINRAGSSVTVTSDGMRVDHTPPILIKLTSLKGTRYQQENDSLHFVWNFSDPESGIREYRAEVYEAFQGQYYTRLVMTY